VITIPVYFNGVADNNQAVEFKYNHDILNIEPVNSNVMVAHSNDTRIAAIISHGYFNPTEPIAFITLDNSANSFTATNVQFFGEKAEDVHYKFGHNNSINDDLLSNAMPNPAVNSTDFQVNITQNGYYKLYISDVNGNVVKVISTGMITPGIHNFT